MVETVRAVMDRLEARRQEEVELSPNGTSLDLLQAVYRNKELPLPTRMRAASLAIPYECCRLGVSVVVNNGQDFASLLDARLKHFEQMKLIEPARTEVTSQSEVTSSTNGGSSEVKTLSRIYNHRLYLKRRF